MAFPIAHRGLSSRYRENSLEAIVAALKYSHVIEFDVRCTADGVPVCTHDDDLTRALGLNLRVGQTDFSTLRQAAPSVPTLAEALDLIANEHGAGMLDVKVSRPRAIEAIIDVVKRSKLEWNNGKQVRAGEPIDPSTLTFQSQNPELLQSFRSRTGAGVIELWPSAMTRRAVYASPALITTYAQGITLPKEFATKKLFQLLRALKLGSYVYTVNDSDSFATISSYGACGIYTDHVDQEWSRL